jgi:hypothetical protein
MSRRTLLGVTVTVVIGVAVVAAVVAARARARQEQQIVMGAVDDIEAQLADLDPVARAAVMGRLAQDAGDVVTGRSSA